MAGSIAIDNDGGGGVPVGKISADFENGLLEITIQGGANLPEPQRIDIRD